MSKDVPISAGPDAHDRGHQFAWGVIAPARRAIIVPSIDPLAPKNQDLENGTTAAILNAAGLRAGSGGQPAFDRLDGSRGPAAGSY